MKNTGIFKITAWCCGTLATGSVVGLAVVLTRQGLYHATPAWMLFTMITSGVTAGIAHIFPKWLRYLEDRAIRKLVASAARNPERSEDWVKLIDAVARLTAVAKNGAVLNDRAHNHLYGHRGPPDET